MVLNSSLVVKVARASAELCQYIACNPERLSSEQVLDLICCFPLQQFGRFALSLWTYLCFDPNPRIINDYYFSSSSSSSFSSDDDSDGDHHHPHSD